MKLNKFSKKLIAGGAIAASAMTLSACEGGMEMSVLSDKSANISVILTLDKTETDILKQSGKPISCEALFAEANAGSSQDTFNQVETLSDDPLSCKLTSDTLPIGSADDVIFNDEGVILDFTKGKPMDSAQLKQMEQIPNFYLKINMPTKIISAPGAEIDGNSATYHDVAKFFKNPPRIVAEPLNGSGSVDSNKDDKNSSDNQGSDSNNDSDQEKAGSDSERSDSDKSDDAKESNSDGKKDSASKSDSDSDEEGMAGWLFWTLIAGGSVLGLAIIGGGIFLLMKKRNSGSDSTGPRNGGYPGPNGGGYPGPGGGYPGGPGNARPGNAASPYGAPAAGQQAGGYPNQSGQAPQGAQGYPGAQAPQNAQGYPSAQAPQGVQGSPYSAAAPVAAGTAAAAPSSAASSPVAPSTGTSAPAPTPVHPSDAPDTGYQRAVSPQANAQGATYQHGARPQNSPFRETKEGGFQQGVYPHANAQGASYQPGILPTSDPVKAAEEHAAQKAQAESNAPAENPQAEAPQSGNGEYRPGQTYNPS
ncbi:hypothetical protein [Boudabousia liubingyangii]|uniref:hypothetical protein n=1 Tax=Boudabousia liubingyangii TaxID=1921764 RepID=UPI001177FF34|nr:hypothetical protein [Boudabousia liubingyangii]